MSVVINGDFLCRNLTGIERFAYETCIRLDKIIEKDSIEIYVPSNAKFLPEFKNIKIVQSSKNCKIFPLWEHIEFSRYAAKNKLCPLDFANVTPFFRPGIVFIHDIYAKLYPNDFSGKKDRLIKAYMCFMYRHAAKHAKKIITVSDFSRQQISKVYGIDPKTIQIIYNGWEHIKNIESDSSILQKYPELKPKKFYFTLGSLQKRKNLKWIADYASEHADELFAISGKAISGMVSDDIKALQTLKNVILVGYVSDEQVKALMESCKAFIFPSYYEGFGIPPLEAISCGAPVIISRAASLPELYGNCAHYIEPDNTKVNLNDILLEKTEPSETVLKKYTYQKAAEDLKEILKNY